MKDSLSGMRQGGLSVRSTFPKSKPPVLCFCRTYRIILAVMVMQLIKRSACTFLLCLLDRERVGAGRGRGKASREER